MTYIFKFFSHFSPPLIKHITSTENERICKAFRTRPKLVSWCASGLQSLPRPSPGPHRSSPRAQTCSCFWAFTLSAPSPWNVFPHFSPWQTSGPSAKRSLGATFCKKPFLVAPSLDQVVSLCGPMVHHTQNGGSGRRVTPGSAPPGWVIRLT